MNDKYKPIKDLFGEQLAEQSIVELAKHSRRKYKKKNSL